ncbi:MAG: hypothetical protein KC586_13015 [Myxococcales bacterium]|nr:hypothetical protein [Myxococcales bacterium]
MVVVRGRDGTLRDVCAALLREGIARDVQLVESFRMTLEGDKSKVSANGRVVWVRVPYAEVRSVMKRFHAALGGEGTAVALPVIAAF